MPASPQILGTSTASGTGPGFFAGAVQFAQSVPSGGTLHLIFSGYTARGDSGDNILLDTAHDIGPNDDHQWTSFEVIEEPLIGYAAVDGSFVDESNFATLIVGSAARFCGANDCIAGNTVDISFYASTTIGTVFFTMMIVYIPAQFYVPIGQDGGSPSEYGNGDGYWPGAPGFGSPTPGEISWATDPYVAPPPYANEDAFVIAAVASYPSTVGWTPTEFTNIGTAEGVSSITASYKEVLATVPFNAGGTGGGADFVTGNYQTSKVQSGPTPGDEGFSVSQRFSQ